MIRVIACGNPDAGDDGVALAIARAVRERLGRSAHVEVIDVGPALNAVPLLEEGSPAIVLDAVRTRGGRSPGQIVRMEAGAQGLPVELRGSVSSHGVGVGEAVAMARALGSTAPIVMIGVETGDVRLGDGLSPAVADAVPRVVELVAGEIVALVSAA